MDAEAWVCEVLVDGSPGLACSAGGTPRVVFTCTIAERRIVAIERHTGPGPLAGFEISR
jgi:hypothetical protein